MKVLFISNDQSIFGEQSAARKRMRAYAEALGDLHILSAAPWSAREVVEGSLHLYPVRVPKLLRLPILRSRARRLIRNASIEVVSVQDPFEYGRCAMRAVAGTPAKLHVQLHTDPFASEFGSSPRNRIRLRIMPKVLAAAARIRVVAEPLKHEIETRYRPAAPISVLPIYVDRDTLRETQVPPGLSERFARFGSKLLVVSRLEAEKDVALAITALARGAPKDACLIILGEGSERARLETLAHALGLSDRVFFEGTQDPAPYYALSDLVLVTSRYEGYGMVIVEALAAGKPVLSTDVGVARSSGARIAMPGQFSESLREWFSSGPREGVLRNYPYANFDEYVRAYAADIAACAPAK